ncbi:MAG TPA: DUF4870 domain-containing protein [Methylophilaceae bacterium]|nr:DUF4870 domain-containing protein [Methylophilaceae bacterium]
MADIDHEPSPAITTDDKNIVVLMHLAGIVFSVFPALLVWLLKRDNNAYIAEQAREALNFQITMLIAQLIGWALAFILIGFVLLGLVWLANIVCCLLAAIAASRGELYRYPFTLRLIS